VLAANAVIIIGRHHHCYHNDGTVQIANVNNCQTIAEFAVRLQGKCPTESSRRFAVVSDKFSSVVKDSIALYL